MEQLEFDVSAVNPRTKIAYNRDLNDWARFLRQRRIEASTTPPAAPKLIADYIDDLVAKRVSASTLRRRMNAFVAWYKDHAIEKDPRLAQPVAFALERARDAALRERQAPIALVEGGLRAVIDKLEENYESETVQPGRDGTLRYLRDRAILLLLYSACLTRGELATLRIENTSPSTSRQNAIDIAVNPSGDIRIHDRWEGWIDPKRTRVICLSRGEIEDYCPVRALRRWMKYAGLDQMLTGYIFRGVRKGGALTPQFTVEAVDNMVRVHAAAASIDVARFSPMSLRAGRIGTMAIQGASIDDMRKTAGLLEVGSLSDVVATGRNEKRPAESVDIIRRK